MLYRTYSLLLDAHPLRKTDRDRQHGLSESAEQRTLNRFATVSSGAGENARFIYVNCISHGDQNCKNDKHDSYQRFTSFPPQLLSQELNHCLKSIRGRNFEEVLLHYRRISNRLKPHDDCQCKCGMRSGVWLVGPLTHLSLSQSSCTIGVLSAPLLEHLTPLWPKRVVTCLAIPPWGLKTKTRGVCT
jgi:hypothetical protein